MGKYNPVGKYVVYIKSPKDNEVNRARALVKASIGTRCTLVDEFIESKEARKNYKPELTKAINKCNEKGSVIIGLICIPIIRSKCYSSAWIT